MNLGLYIHVPFCRCKCDYCSFYSVPLGDDALLERYTGFIMGNIQSALAECGDFTVNTLYIGGGTPSLLREKQAERILRAVTGSVETAPDIEVSLELNPEDASAEKVAGFRDAGFNRFILGVQTLDRAAHRLIGRSNSSCEAAALEEFTRIPGIVPCVDVITGIPGQGAGELVRELETVATFRPRHISAYPLSVEPSTPLAGRIQKDDTLDDLQREAFEATISTLAGAGYRHYEISNYALPGYESRHNMKYWRFDQYLGFGPGAHSFFRGDRFYHAPKLHPYMETGVPERVNDPRTGQQALVEYIITGMRLLEGISMVDMKEKTGHALTGEFHQKIEGLASRGFIGLDETENDMRIFLTGEGIFLADRVLFELVEHLLE